MNSRIIRIAIKAAQKSPSRFRVGAVVHRGSKILGVGYNSMNKTHPKAKTLECKRHAELMAVIEASKRVDSLHGCGIYVHRLKRDGSPGFSAPCIYCSDLLAENGIRKIRYSEDS